MGVRVENLKIVIDSHTSDGGNIELSVTGLECQIIINSNSRIGDKQKPRNDVRIELSELSGALEIIKSYLQSKFNQ